MEPTIYQDNSNMFVRIYEYIRHKLLHFTLRYSSKIINRALFNVKPYVDYTDYHYKSRLNEIRKKKGFILDMDGTIWVTTKLGQRKLIKGVVEFFNWCRKEGKEFIMLTNGSMKNQKALRQRVLDLCNIDIPENRFVTSATSTASFIREQSPHFYTSVFAVGDSCLKEALEHEGIVHDDDVNPTFVVFGESRSYSYKDIVKAINLVNNGARLLATNSDLVDIDENGEMDPSCGAFVSIIEKATGVKAYYLGKPNPLMMRHALDKMKCDRSECAIIGDRMDTDILAGTESKITPVLVLTGVTKKEHLNKFAYMPYIVLNSIADIVPKEFFQ